MTIHRPRLRALLVISFALAPLTVASQQPDTSTDAVVRAASAYVADYQQRLTSVVADESLEQEVLRRAPTAASDARQRRMVSEVFFMFIPGTNNWMAIRDVISVDGAEVPDRGNVRRELETLADHRAAAALMAQNSRFNIGRITRNFSEPTLCLLVLDDKHRNRFRFKRRGVQRVADVTLVTLAFTEKESPTLIRDAVHGKVFSTGEIVVEAGSGRVRQTTFRVRSGDISVELTTNYAADGRLEMWVPASFHEVYQTLQSRTDYEHVVARAAYSNFRRFQTAVRIK
jgi:hypothetical protein